MWNNQIVTKRSYIRSVNIGHSNKYKIRYDANRYLPTCFEPYGAFFNWQSRLVRYKLNMKSEEIAHTVMTKSNMAVNVFVTNPRNSELCGINTNRKWFIGNELYTINDIVSLSTYYTDANMISGNISRLKNLKILTIKDNLLKTISKKIHRLTALHFCYQNESFAALISFG